MKQTIIITMMILSMITLASAGVIYSGETYEIESGLDEVIVWSIINNNTFIDARDYTNHSIIVVMPEDVEDMTFSVEFKGYRNEEERIVYRGGGSGRISYKNNTIYLPYNNTVYQDKIIETIKEINNTIFLDSPYDPEGNNYGWIAFGVLLSGLIIFFIIRGMSNVPQGNNSVVVTQ
jgi:hypothetical protein